MCELAQQQLGWEHLSAGDLLRAERKAGGTVEQPPPIQMLTMVNTLGVTGINLTAQQ